MDGKENKDKLLIKLVNRSTGSRDGKVVFFLAKKMKKRKNTLQC